MLAEWLRHLCTWAPAHLRQMGYVRELIAIEARHRRCRAAWAPHLENCKKLIVDAAEDVNPGQVTVLGSGLLLEVPVEELANKFEDVVLVDIFHMPVVERRVRDLANVRLLTADVTGLVEAAYRHPDLGRGTPLPAPGNGMEWLAGADLVVSANLLAQLPVLPMAWIREKAPGDGGGDGCGDGETDAFARRIVEHHLDLLGRLPGRVALISETERVFSKGDEVPQATDPLFGVSLPRKGARQWVWTIAPRPEISRHIDLRFRMAGIADLKAAL